jgi:hypothetical protein
MIYITVFSMFNLSKYDLFHRSSINILQDIQHFPNHCNKLLNPQRKFRSADSTGYLNRRLLKVNLNQIHRKPRSFVFNGNGIQISAWR